MTVHAALKAVMSQVQKIDKTGRNKEQNYRFRGIDAVINEVGPALREHGVLVIPEGDEITSEHYDTRKGARMRSVTMRVRWKIYGPDGDFIESATYGEAADAGDKAVSKAHAVAWRTVLLQALCIPTGDPDPDATTYERAAPDDVGPGEVRAAKERVRAAWLTTFGSFDLAEATDHYGRWSRGGVLSDASAPELRRYAAYLTSIEKDAGSDPATASSEAAVVDSPRPITSLQRKRIFAELNGRGIRDAAEQRTRLGEILGTPVTSRGDLTLDDAKKVIDWFEQNPQTADNEQEGQ
jgi:hypothetical protein